MSEENVAVESTAKFGRIPGGPGVGKLIPKRVKSGIKKLLYRLGFGLCPQDAIVGSVRVKMMQHHGIQAVIDVGGNVGGYGAELREYGYSGRIISFEPTAQAYEKLAARAKADPKWIVSKTAIGEFSGEV